MSQAKVLNGLQIDQDVFKLSKQKETGRHAPGSPVRREDWTIKHTSLRTESIWKLICIWLSCFLASKYSRFLLIYQKQKYISKCTPFSTTQPVISLIHDNNCKKDFTPQASQFGICVLVNHPEVHRISYSFVFKIQFPLSNRFNSKIHLLDVWTTIYIL